MESDVPPFSGLDLAALAFFIIAWLGYHVAVEVLPGRDLSLNSRMNLYRQLWMERMLARDNRIVDTTIMASLQNGTAFFASTSLIAVGGVLALMRLSDDVIGVFAELPLGLSTSKLAWELKLLGLAIIFVYAFFKFAWSYRLFNYAAILVGAVPVKPADDAEAVAAARRAAAMNVVAGRHFNRGQRAYFFALAYLGWAVSAWLFMAATAAVLVVMWRRQFGSAPSRRHEGPELRQHRRDHARPRRRAWPRQDGLPLRGRARAGRPSSGRLGPADAACPSGRGRSHEAGSARHPPQRPARGPGRLQGRLPDRTGGGLIRSVVSG
jgi:uncharacterized membrane protein